MYTQPPSLENQKDVHPTDSSPFGVIVNLFRFSQLANNGSEECALDLHHSRIKKDVHPIDSSPIEIILVCLSLSMANNGSEECTLDLHHSRNQKDVHPIDSAPFEILSGIRGK